MTVDAKDAMLNALEALSDALFNLKQVTSIAAGIVDHLYLQDAPSGGKQAVMSEAAFEQLVFAVYDAQKRAGEASDAFRAAMLGEASK